MTTAMEDFQKDGARVFKGMLKSKGFSKAEIKAIIEVVDAQPILIREVSFIDVQSKDGVITVKKAIPGEYTTRTFKTSDNDKD